MGPIEFIEENGTPPTLLEQTMPFVIMFIMLILLGVMAAFILSRLWPRVEKRLDKLRPDYKLHEATYFGELAELSQQHEQRLISDYEYKNSVQEVWQKRKTDAGPQPDGQDASPVQEEPAQEGTQQEAKPIPEEAKKGG